MAQYLIMGLLKTKYYSSSIFNPFLELPSFGAEDFSVTISGFGSGSTFAQTAGIIFSQDVQGLGLFSGCSYSDLNNKSHTDEPEDI